MRRRDWLLTVGSAVAASAGGALALRESPVAGAAASSSPGLPPMKITDVRTILTAPGGVRLVVVKVTTSEPGLYGLGCATFTQRARTVETAVQQYLRPFLLGKDPERIEDIWQSSFVSSYWRNGPVLNNAISGVDMALWDIKGKRAGMPLYQLLGGKCREAVPVYRHASGADFRQVEDSVRRFMEDGVRHVRVQVGIPGRATYGARSRTGDTPEAPKRRRAGTWEAARYVRTVPKLFEHLRATLGDEVELLHDVHERVPPIQAIALAKELERYRLFFLEDPFAPEDVGYFPLLRGQASTPIAMGELFNNPNEWVPLVSQRLIDFLRVHLSQVGGLTMGRKLAALCEFFAVRTAWHGPPDVSPVGHAANLHLDLATHNFGIQEFVGISDRTREVFPGTPDQRGGCLYANDRPGLGIDLDEKLAARFPIRDDPSFDMHWGNLRKPDGTVVKP